MKADFEWMEDFSPCSDNSDSLKLPVNAVEEDTQHAPISVEEYIEEQALILGAA